MQAQTYDGKNYASALRLYVWREVVMYELGIGALYVGLRTANIYFLSCQSHSIQSISE